MFCDNFAFRHSFDEHSFNVARVAFGPILTRDLAGSIFPFIHFKSSLNFKICVLTVLVFVDDCDDAVIKDAFLTYWSATFPFSFAC